MPRTSNVISSHYIYKLSLTSVLLLSDKFCYIFGHIFNAFTHANVAQSNYLQVLIFQKKAMINLHNQYVKVRF
jgi:hypothetical protein